MHFYSGFVCGLAHEGEHVYPKNPTKSTVDRRYTSAKPTELFRDRIDSIFFKYKLKAVSISKKNVLLYATDEISNATAEVEGIKKISFFLRF